jgi:glycosyltransferase involved in cell wall biosynthesis
VPLGIRIDDFRAIDRPTSDRHGDGAPAGDNGWLAPRVPLTIGYLARICPEKGFHLLVDAWLRMRQDPRCSDIRLSAAGWLGKHDQPYFEQQLHAIQHAGAADDFSHAGVVNRAGKLRFLAGLDIFSVPTLYREPKGLYVLEALAAGVPVVQPDHGAFPEMLRATGGGKLFHPGDVEDLARVLTELATNPAARRELGEQGRRQVHASCGAAQMAEATLAAFRSVADR